MTKITLAAVLIASSLPAFAAGNLKIGSVEVKPMLSSEQKTDSNIYLTPKTGQASSINQTSAGVDLGLNIKERHKITLGYQADFISYSEKPSINDAIHQTANLGLSCEMPSGWSSTASDKFLDTTDPASSELVQRARRSQNDITATVDKKAASGLSYGVSFQDSMHDYSNDTLGDTLNRQEYRYGAHLGYPIGSKTSATLGYTYSKINYDKDGTNKKNSSGNEVTLGVDGRLASKVTGSVSAGYLSRSYEHSITGGTNDFATMSYGAKVAWAPTGRTDVTLGGKKGFSEATFGNNRFFNSSTVEGSVSQKIGNKTTAKAFGSYEWDNYTESSTIGSHTAHRADDVKQIGLNLDYQIQESLNVGASHLHRARTSNFGSTFGYTDDITGVHLKLTF